jgi:beta-glucosidase
MDRTNICVSPTQVDVLKRIAKLNENIVVVLHAGSAIDVSEWEHLAKAIVYVGFAGEAATEASADILTGKVCPSGKLSETFPLSLEETAVGKYEGDGFTDWYKEGIFVGYRYYDTFEKEVRYPFGFGLSYANFEYSDLKIEKKGETDYDVVFTVKNTSNIDAKEISQVYVRDVFARVIRPLKELKGFAKTALKAGESKQVRISLNERSFAYYSIPLKKWHVENGEFEILVGSSSKDIRLKESVKISLPFDTQATNTF